MSQICISSGQQNPDTIFRLIALRSHAMTVVLQALLILISLRPSVASGSYDVLTYKQGGVKPWGRAKRNQQVDGCCRASSLNPRRANIQSRDLPEVCTASGSGVHAQNRFLECEEACRAECDRDAAWCAHAQPRAPPHLCTHQKPPSTLVPSAEPSTVCCMHVWPQHRLRAQLQLSAALRDPSCRRRPGG